MNVFKKIISLSDEIDFSGKKIKQSAVIVPFVKVNNTESVLFEIRSDKVPQPGEICFPGGNRNSADISLRHTTVRETSEELGIKESSIANVTSLGVLHSSIGNEIHIFTAELNISSIIDLNINKDEVEKVFVIPAEYFMSNVPEIYSVNAVISPFKDGKVTFPAKELNLPVKYHSDWGFDEKKVYVYKTEHGVIWGITAQIIHEIYNACF